MATYTIGPTAFEYSEASSVVNPENAYDSSATTYATVQLEDHTVYLYGFNFSKIPSGEAVTDISVKVKSTGDALEVPVAWLQSTNDSAGVKLSQDVSFSSSTATTKTIPLTADINTVMSYKDTLSIAIKANALGVSFNLYAVWLTVDTVIPSANKVVYGNETLIDLTGDTATASDVAVGKIFHLASGMIATGTLQGVEVESGTWSPTSNTVRGTINFTNTHDEPPVAFVVWDTGSTTNDISAVFEVCFDYEALFGEALTGRASSYKATRYGMYYSSSSSSSNFTRNCSHGRSDTGDSDENYYRYHATESLIRPLVLTGSSYGWRKTRTYNWVAIWV